jgi:hypothetical protein
VDPQSGARVTGGYAVAVHPEREWSAPAADVTAADIDNFHAANADLWSDSTNKLGGWHDPETGTAYLDVSTVVSTPAQATALAVKHGQLAYFDLEAGASVNVMREPAGRHYQGQHDQATHGNWSAGTSTTMSAIGKEGREAVISQMEKRGITFDDLHRELVDRIHMLSDDQIAEAKRWYEKYHDLAVEWAEELGYDPEAMMGCFSAVSPQIGYERATWLARQIAEKLPELSHLSAAEAAKHFPGLKANIKQGIEVLRGGKEQVGWHLTGTKRRSFYNNILAPGQTQDVTIDTWMERLVVRASGITKEEAHAFINAQAAATKKAGAGYVCLSEAVRNAAATLGWSPDQVQAAYWVALRDFKL